MNMDNQREPLDMRRGGTRGDLKKLVKWKKVAKVVFGVGFGWVWGKW